MKDRRFAIFATILCGGFVAGTIDVGAAALIYWVSPIIILHAIASGILGKSAFIDGAPVAALGLGLQWAMSLLIAAVYVAGVHKIPLLGHAGWPAA